MSFEAVASVPTEPREWPEVVVRDSKSHPELGTQANPIVIGDEPAPLGSASNPIVINVDEGLCHSEAVQPNSDADTEIMTTPEFWEKLIEESRKKTKLSRLERWKREGATLVASMDLSLKIILELDIEIRNLLQERAYRQNNLGDVFVL